jgi:FkbM family methyltransferase
VNFSGISKQSLVGAALRLPLSLISPNAIVRILQGPLRGKKWIAGSHSHGCWLGSYEYDKQQLFRRYVRPGDVVYDLGANVGFYSLLASVLTGPDGRVFSFEPAPSNLAYLRRHLELNGISNCVVFDCAVSSAAGSASFSVGASRAESHLTVTPGASSHIVKTVALDDLVASKELPPPNVIKCDIEGGEYDALRGASQILKQHQPLIFLATHSPEIHERCCSLLTSLGYRLQSLDDRPLERTDEVIAIPAGVSGANAKAG